MGKLSNTKNQTLNKTENTKIAKTTKNIKNIEKPNKMSQEIKYFEYLMCENKSKHNLDSKFLFFFILLLVRATVLFIQPILNNNEIFEFWEPVKI